MTDQVLDSILYQGKGYSLLNAEPAIFSPWDYGIKPESISSSNAAGYIACYKVTGKQLQLDTLRVAYPTSIRRKVADKAEDAWANLLAKKAPLPLLNAIAANRIGSGYWQYDAIGLALNYSGTLFLENSTESEPISIALASGETVYLQLIFDQGQLHSATQISQYIQR